MPREMLKQCTANPTHPVMHSEALARIVRPRQRYAYDLIVQVGLARYLRNKQREEIRAELLQQRGINLSNGSISNLCDRFLSYFEALHLIRAPYLRAAIEKQGGYPLHLDATNDHGKGGLFVCMDGFRGWVLVSGKIPSEHEDHLRPLVEKTVSLFGHPLSTMRDLMKAGPRTVASIRESGKPDLVCHYHFLGAVGKKLFDGSYSTLRDMLKQSKLRSDCYQLLRELRRPRKSANDESRLDSGRVRDDLLALIYWILEGDGKKKPRYPFTLPLLEFFHRCRQAMRLAERWVPVPRTLPEQRALQHLGVLMARVEEEKQFVEVAGQLEKSWQAFCELRDVLRLTNAELPIPGTRVRPREAPAVEYERLQAIEEATEKYLQRLRCRVGDQDKRKHLTPDAVILKYAQSYGDHLFGHPVICNDDGEIIAVAERTNYIAEHFFSVEKQGLRRRLGKAQLGRDLEDQPPQAALVANLRHDEYIRILCGSLENLENAFAELDQKALDDTTPLSRENRVSNLRRRVRALLEHEVEYPTVLVNTPGIPEIVPTATVV